MVGDADVARYWSKVDRRRHDECWPWLGEVKENGYGRFLTYRGGKRRHYAHRIAYELASGPIPPGYDVDHTCHNGDESCAGGWACRHRRCCNPAHLRATTRRVNLAEGRRPPGGKTRTHCKWGHAFDEANTWVSPNSGHRQCRACNLRRQHETQRRKRERAQ